jgi:cation diffusion facilitator CzcD-associated flavoprotein CzcO
VVFAARAKPSGTGRRIVVIGAGPGGICTGIKLKQAGIENFVILEKGDGVGGTWFHNRYPGAACDVQSHLYSFSFEIKKDWLRPYATQPEILEYLEHCVAKYGLTSHIRLGTEVRGAYWDEECTLWRVVTEHGDEIAADVVISAIGMFNDLNFPDIPGLADFGGTMFHSARWDQNADLDGKAVAVIGSAASAVQFVPEIAKRAGQLTVFQRSANWVGPREDAPFTPEQLEAFQSDPLAARRKRWQIWRTIEGVITFSDPEILRRAEAAGRANINAVNDPELRRKLTPATPFGCQRPLSSNVYYPTFNRPNVELVTEAIDRIGAKSTITVDGTERFAEVIILATGFKTTKYLSAIEVSGREGKGIDEAWSEGAQAYLGITTSGFPNLFMLYGPNTNNGSILFMIECQVAYILRQLRRMDDEQIAWMDVRRQAMEDYNTELQHHLDAVEVWQAGCHGYYRGPSGRIVTQWPHTMAVYRDRSMRPDPHTYELHHGAPL